MFYSILKTWSEDVFHQKPWKVLGVKEDSWYRFKRKEMPLKYYKKLCDCLKVPLTDDQKKLCDIMIADYFEKVSNIKGE